MVVLWGCGGIVVIDHESTEDTGWSVDSDHPQEVSSGSGVAVACGGEAVVEGAHVCWRADYDGRCITDVCDDTVSYWRSECFGGTCRCFHDNTVEPTCTCQRVADDACPGTTCCPAPWQG
jgi:hypothetical protein